MVNQDGEIVENVNKENAPDVVEEDRGIFEKIPDLAVYTSGIAVVLAIGSALCILSKRLRKH